MLENTTIIIPSSGRADKQITLAQLPEQVRKVTRLAVYVNELCDYSEAHDDLMVVPRKVTNISEKRRYIMDSCKTRYLLMLDDDLTFAYRPVMESPKLLPCSTHRVEGMLGLFHVLIKGYAHVSLSARQGNNHVDQVYKELGRVSNAYMYDLERVRAAKVEVGRIPLMEDFDLTLQLLRAGLPNAMIYRYCYNQSGSNTVGGCSQYRTTELQAESAHKLAELHSGFVRVVKKKTKNWKGMEERTDVVVSWQKAYKSSKQVTNA